MRMARRKGQIALIGVVVLAATLLALAAMVKPGPAFAYERGHLQGAQLVHLSRACLASGRCDNATLSRLVSALLRANATEPIRMYPIASYASRWEQDPSSRLARNSTLFQLRTPRGVEAVSVTVVCQVVAEYGTYRKQVRTEMEVSVTTMANLTVYYAHVYSTPWFALTLCPTILPDGVADAKRVADCYWRVGVPADARAYTLRDEYGVPVLVYRG